MQVSATGFAQRVTLDEKKATFEQVFKKMHNQTGYDFMYNRQLLNKKQKVDIKANNESLELVLEKLLEGQSLEFSIDEKIVVIKEKAPSFLDRIIDRFRAIDIKGKVLDENGAPLVGATVTVKGTNRVAKTDQNGAFFLNSIEDKAVLVISYIGYATREVEAASDIGSLTLNLADARLEEVKINAGYYSITDRERTGSISRITSKDIEKQPVNNILMALQNRVPGLQITQQTGVPGGGFSIQIRGQNSIHSGNDPLYIIDGVNFPSTQISGSSTLVLGASGASPMSTLNPNDIESVEVLKDADATAIYGSRGANGVVLITTKKGKAAETKILAGINQGFSQVAHHVDLLNTEEYLIMRREAFKNDGLEAGAEDFDVNGTWDQTRNTNWQKELIGGNAATTNAFLSISGGTAKGNYLVAGNYYKEGTVYPGDFGFKRYGIRSSINLGSIDSRFKSTFAFNVGHIESNLFSFDLTHEILLAPNQPDPYDMYGNLNWSDNTVQNNPMSFLQNTYDAGTDNLVANLNLSYSILKNLFFQTSIGYTTIRRKEIQKNPLVAVPPVFGYTSAQRTSVFSDNFNNTFLAEPTLNYTARIGPGKFDAIIGLSFQTNDYELSTTNASGFNSDELMGNLSSAFYLTNFTNSTQYHYAAGFGRINYSIADKYYFNLTGRRDGSSRFGPGRQFANFGALGGAWIFSEEKLIKQIFPFMSLGKLRASFGVTGNDQIANDAYLQLWNSNGTYQGSSTLTPGSNAPNTNFAWETTKKIEAAVQLGMLNNRINLEVAYYKNRSSNQLLSRSLPLSTGKGGLLENLPATVQNKGWEFNATVKILNSDQLQWSAGLNISLPKNTLLSYPNLEISSDANTYVVGEPLAIFKTYKVIVDGQTGIYSFEDKNNKGALDPGNRYIINFLGQSSYGGVQNSLKYKQFNLDFVFSFTSQKGRSFTAQADQLPGRWQVYNSVANQYSEVLERWQQTDNETLIQRFGTTSITNIPNLYNKYYGNLSVVDASYIRLKTLSLSYDLPDTWINSLKIKGASINFQAQNLMTFTKYVGLDPETQSHVLPPLRTFMLGVNVTF